MVLSQKDLQSLVESKQRNPHHFLGMHKLDDGQGVVARALAPKATAVELEPVHEKDKPSIALQRLGSTDVFEGVAPGADRVYAYDLLITEPDGKVRQIGRAHV
jgi:hypothetical protein